MRSAGALAALSIAGAALLAGLIWLTARGGAPSTGGAAGDGGDPLVVYCAAGLKPAVEEVARRYEEEYGVPVQLQYGGSGTLLSNIKIARRGDLFIAADDSYIAAGRADGVIDEAIPLAVMTPVIVVAARNPMGVERLEDLGREGVAAGYANPDAAAIGRITRQVLGTAGLWDDLSSRAKVLKPTVTDLANDVKLGAIDAAVVWDATAGQYPELETVRDPRLDAEKRLIEVGVVGWTERPARALRFARYLGARDRGLPVFRENGYEPVEGDLWEETPRVILYSGGINRVAVDDTIAEFEKREGVRIERIYNGCGILVAQMKAGQRPDAYFACDTSFVVQVADLFSDPVDISRSDIVILAGEGNPHGIGGLADLAAEGLAVGVCNPEQSALGALTQKLLDAAGLREAVMENVRTQTPTADMLVNQMKTGALDAAIVYRANCAYVKDSLTLVAIDHPAASAVQPYAIAQDSGNRRLMERLLALIESAESRARFEAAGFEWRAPEP